MAEYYWPSKKDSRLLGGRHERMDGLAKTTGAAKYTYDVNLPNQLIVRALGSPHAHCKILSVDTSAAKKVPGVAYVYVIREPKKGENGEMMYPEIQTEGELLVAVAAETEAAAAEGVSKVEIKYDMLDVFVSDEDLPGAEKAGRTSKAGGKIELEREPGDDDDEEEFENAEMARLFKEAAHVVEGYYGIDVIAHCCLEPHGSTVQWKDGKLDAYLSTQNVSKTDDGFAAALDLTADDVDVHCEYIGGGFGSKFKPDYWGIAAAVISRETGRPVKFMLTRDQELKVAGNRPSGYLKVKLGADKDGVVQVWDSHHWGTSGYNGGGVSDRVIPYVYRPKNYRRVATAIAVDADPQRAWRAPNHPQACAITQTAYDDLAAKMQTDSLDIFMKNLANIESRQKAEVYAEELKIAAELMDWKAKWHPHGKGPKKGSVVDGLGIGIHEWGGVANSSTCLLRIHPDGGVESYCGTQDIGTGTRTVCAVVLAETFGLGVNDVKINVGHSTFPESGASGGSTTVGAVSESHRRAGQDALEQLFAVVAPALGAQPGDLKAVDGKIVAPGGKSLTWKEACSKLGMKKIEVTANYERGDKSPLSDEGVGGVQMAHVSVDLETGRVKVNKVVAVQDMGLIINRTAAESQIYGAVIMGIAYSLFEQRIMDPKTGVFLNAELSDYKLPRLGDIGEIVVEMYEPESERARGVIGLGEPPVISTGAAISNAICNATGVRVPVLPLTPKRVLEALG